MNLDFDFIRYSAIKQKQYSALGEFFASLEGNVKSIHINFDTLNLLKLQFSDIIEKREQFYNFKDNEHSAFKNKIIEVFPQMNLIKQCKGLALYWFENLNPQLNSKIHSEFIKRKGEDRILKRNYSQSKERKDIDDFSGSVLYVGITETKATLFNRILSHLGLWHLQTVGLQLVHWASQIDSFECRLNFIEIDPNSDFALILEDIEGILFTLNEPLFGEGPRIGIASSIQQVVKSKASH